MRAFISLMLMVALACGVSSCGNKGKLKSPSQIQAAADKKAKKDAAQDGAPATDGTTPPAPGDAVPAPATDVAAPAPATDNTQEK